MKKYTKEELTEILSKHKLWLAGEAGGERANLSKADLSGADLSKADLSGADLFGADLYGANLSGADLSKADLSGANLFGANLSGASLFGADLDGANLSGADLSGANLSMANLLVANLSGAKGLTMFQAGKHLALFTGTDKLIIGCHVKTLQEWLSCYEQVGKAEGYTKQEIAMYGAFIKFCFNKFERAKNDSVKKD